MGNHWARGLGFALEQRQVNCNRSPSIAWVLDVYIRVNLIKVKLSIYLQPPGYCLEIIHHP